MTLVKTTYNRRSFLKTSVAAGGGLLIGFNWLVSCKPTPKQVLEMPEEWFNINAYLKIGENGVATIFSPNPEIGQNVKTAMPMIVAEELDIDWKNVLVEQAALDSDKYDRQVAGGSQSIRRSWQGLRMAGATARRMLLEAAAKEWQVPVEELTTENGVISHPSGKSAGYGDFAMAATQVAVPEEVKLKDPKDFTLIGTPTKNVDGPKIVKGEPLFGLDYEKDGMLIAMIVHAPAFGMKPKSVDDSQARSMPGIKDVFIIDSSTPEGTDPSWAETNAFHQLVAIVGTSTWEVMKAKKTLKIEWETASDPESTSQQFSKLEALIDKKTDKPRRVDGQPDQAFQKAAKVIEQTYYAPFLAHNTMEPMNFFAHVTTDKVDLAGPIQTPAEMRSSVSKVTGIPEDNITLTLTRIGGGFGRRLYVNFGVEAALISQKAKAPVKLIYTREDDMTQGTYRPMYAIKYRAALDENNQLTAFHVRSAGVNGTPLFANRYPAGAVDNYLAEGHFLESNVSTGAWRAPNSNFVACAEQSFLDEVAEAAGKDPVDFRLELFDRAAKNPVGENNDYEADRYAGVLKLVKEKAGWGEQREGVYRGVSAYFCHNSYVAQVVDLVMKDGEPQVQKVWCAVDCGIVVNPEGAKNQVEGAIVDGIGHSMYSALTMTDGKPDQQNFDRYRMIRMKDVPFEIETFFVQNSIDPTGLGEPALPPVQAALANAIYAATGKRLTKQPFSEQLKEEVLAAT